MNVSITTTSGGSTPETFTDIIMVSVMGDKIMLTKKTVKDELAYNRLRDDFTSLTITRGAGS